MNPDIKPRDIKTINVWLVGALGSPLLTEYCRTASGRLGFARATLNQDGTVSADGTGVDVLYAAWVKRAVVDAMAARTENPDRLVVRACVHVQGVVDGASKGVMPLQRAPGSFYEGVQGATSAPHRRRDEIRLRGDIDRVVGYRERAEYMPWCVQARITFLASMIREDEVHDLLRVAGTLGVGAMTPRRGGCHGRFEVRTDKQKVVTATKAAGAVLHVQI